MSLLRCFEKPIKFCPYFQLQLFSSLLRSRSLTDSVRLCSSCLGIYLFIFIGIALSELLSSGRLRKQMQTKREPCRNFQRGSCRYGDRCKFLHVMQQQPKSSVFGTQNSLHQQQKTNPFGFGSQTTAQQQSNPFGFGTQSSSQQQSNPFGFGSQSGAQLHQKPNPFGFGSQTNSQQQQQKTNPFGFGVQGGSQSKQNQLKPFENKWTRSTAGGATQQSDNQSQAANHKCTDPETCKRQIAEDFEHERPLWKLTCYSHSKNAPCDIVGDISYEELRAAAYDDAKRGMSFESIVERERNLLNSKLAEFDNLLQKPCKNPTNSSDSIQSPLIGLNANAFSQSVQNQNPPTTSSFGQLNAPLHTDIGIRHSMAPNYTPAQQSSFQNQGPFASQSSNQTFGSSFAPNLGGFSSMVTANADGNSFSTSARATNITNSFANPSAFTSGGPGTSTFFTPTNGVRSVNSLQTDKTSVDASIWLKEKWTPGEIPEEAPPDIYVK